MEEPTREVVARALEHVQVPYSEHRARNSPISLVYINDFCSRPRRARPDTVRALPPDGVVPPVWFIRIAMDES